MIVKRILLPVLVFATMATFFMSCKNGAVDNVFPLAEDVTANVIGNYALISSDTLAPNTTAVIRVNLADSAGTNLLKITNVRGNSPLSQTYNVEITSQAVFGETILYRTDVNKITFAGVLNDSLVTSVSLSILGGVDDGIYYKKW